MRRVGARIGVANISYVPGVANIAEMSSGAANISYVPGVAYIAEVDMVASQVAEVRVLAIKASNVRSAERY